MSRTWQGAQRELIYNMLLHSEGGAAQMLDINPSTLEARMRKLGIRRKQVVEKLTT